MTEYFYKKEFLSGCILIVFTSITCLMGLFYLRQTLSGVETPMMESLLRGTWPLQFEKAFRETLPVNTASRSLWGRAEYALFHQGRKGVVIGTEGWLFTDEEFSCPPHAQQNLADNLVFIDDTRGVLAEMDTRLVLVLIPAKARLLSGHLNGNSLPPCRENLYTDAHATLVKKGIIVTDLLPAMQSSSLREALFLKTDTHWSPAGARFSAQSTAALARTALQNIDLHTDHFSSQAGSVKIHEGDLTSYIPGVPLPTDHFTSYVSGVSVASMGAAQNLFSDTIPPITLVGTSYSANPNWNFEGFLKEALKMDILNLSDQGLGPFVVMDKYLQNDAWKDSPPRLIVWEVPERYLLMPHGTAH